MAYDPDLVASVGLELTSKIDVLIVESQILTQVKVTSFYLNVLKDNENYFLNLIDLTLLQQVLG